MLFRPRREVRQHLEQAYGIAGALRHDAGKHLLDECRRRRDAVRKGVRFEELVLFLPSLVLLDIALGKGLLRRHPAGLLLDKLCDHRRVFRKRDPVAGRQLVNHIAQEGFEEMLGFRQRGKKPEKPRGNVSDVVEFRDKDTRADSVTEKLMHRFGERLWIRCSEGVD